MNLSKSFSNAQIDQIKSSNSLVENVYQAIRESIISGRIPQGGKLKQLDLAKDLNVSQPIVREALARLSTSGLVEQMKNRGFYASKPNLKDQEDIYRVRIMVEGFAALEAANKITKEQLEAMKDLLPNTAILDSQKSIQEIRQNNHRFHLIIVLAANNKYLLNMYNQISDLIITYFRDQNVSEKEGEQSANSDIEDHKAIVKALETKDGEMAKQLLEKHINDNYEEYKRRYLTSSKDK